MKKTLLIAAIVSLVLCACTSNEKKAQNLIKEYLAEDLEYPTTYKPISFGTLDSLFTSLETDEQMAYYLDMIGNCTQRAQDASRNLNKVADEQFNAIIREQVQSSLDRAEKYRKDMEEYEANFKSEFIGWSMRHDYQYTDKNGIDKTWGIFIFDEDLTAVLEER